MGKTVGLVWHCKTDEGWKRFPVLRTKNGKIRTGWVIEDGSEKQYPNGAFHIRSYMNGKPLYTAVGDDPIQAEHVRRKSEFAKQVKIDADSVGLKLISSQPIVRVKLQDAIDRFIAATKDNNAHVAAKVYAVALDDFLNSQPELKFVDQITAQTMSLFSDYLRAKGNSERTLSNKHTRIYTFLRWMDITPKELKLKTPKFDKKLPLVYDTSELEKILNSEALPEYWRLTINLLRQTGLREMEAVYLQWTDLDLTNKVLRVKAKPEIGFRIKDREERDVNLPSTLVVALKAWRKKHPHTEFVIGTNTDKPNHKLLRSLKRLVNRLGLNCGVCEGCKETGYCRKFTLHAFRRTYATSLSRAGIDVKTIQTIMGHSDVKTTMGYLAAMKTADMQPLIDQVKW